ncbi:PAS domain-containing hybrid sensor histidine kinase/response regulator [Phaeobacter gallaeciensis]|uniref:histidine kinase n=1 Tax=Phaeobacter gallaeciensis TaxID=60890 RepID=A0AAC9Z5X6_9RHOB|nr:ATP-binding protein [Phaeobacter gallaeciensis]AHD07837.1 PAS/PAC sensor hybrid histidine kinase [Phaeobacter gallaeciensis DSM 26640]ATE91105.1 signal transduction histidine kinase [Phaeobacter gallaeciensis]ATE95380.1 signal transduction histidine kinase [Phaeobacter gallaeciensis]ATE99719.1 signal transduction histidine kinase [Phaeobacter gallaeciensis]ATF04152.1 signal transduction histidine kinase [Phaeobacter gallaeciensis]
MSQADALKNGPLDTYNRRYSQRGLLNRYADGRAQYFAYRQMTMAGLAALIGLLTFPLVGLLVFLVAFLGDMLDTVYLARATPIGENARFRHVQVISAITAAIQALSLAFLAWSPSVFMHSEDHLHQAHATPLFTVGILVGAAINATVILPYNVSAGITRLAIYGLTPLAMIALESHAETGGGMEEVHLFQIAGLGVLYFSVFFFVSFIVGRYNRSRKNTLAMALQHKQLAQINAKLQAQQLQSQRLALVAENANDSVFLMDEEGRISWVNEAFTRITGFRYDEAIGKMPGALLNGDDTDMAVVRALEKGRATGKPFRLEICNRRKDGQLLWLETNQVPMLRDDGTVETIIAVERDVTAAKQYEQQLKDARIAAEEGARVKSEFLATMSHEIRTPMNGVIGMAQMLERTDLDDEQKLYADTILGSARTLLSLINDVLDLSKMDAGEVILSEVDFDLPACFQQTLQLFEPQAQEKGITLDLDIAPDVPRIINGDDRRLRQVLLNLIGNAVKFTEAGGVGVAVTTSRVGDRLRLRFSVTDTGIGIAKEKQDQIFERFSQADAAITRRFGGTGLGLTISRLLCEAMGGEIDVTSDPGKGSCFSVHLRMQPATGSDLTEAADAAQHAGRSLQGMRILVAEDNRINRLLVEKYLQDEPVTLEFAVDGAEAMEKTPDFDPDVILMDMSMPVMNGLDATRNIREMDIRQPVIAALTANAFDSDREACLTAGMDDFLSKPINRDDLLAVLRKHCPAQGRRATG